MTEVQAQKDMFRSVVITADGSEFSTRAEAVEYLRKPQILSALNALTENNESLSEWFYDNRDDVAGAFEVGTVRRVTKGEHKKLGNALEAVVAANDPETQFLIDHASVIASCFKWPTVKKMSDAEKKGAARKAMTELTDNAEVVEWALAKTEGLLEAFEAGKIKRPVSEKATAGLTNYRMTKVAEKAVKECSRLVNVDGVDAGKLALATALAAKAVVAADLWQSDHDAAKKSKDHVANIDLAIQMNDLAGAAKEAYEAIDPDFVPKEEEEKDDA